LHPSVRVDRMTDHADDLTADDLEQRAQSLLASWWGS
jgi:hypothetical protein